MNNSTVKLSRWNDKLPHVLFNIISSYVNARERLTYVERTSRSWHKMSSSGCGWSDNLDLWWFPADWASVLKHLGHRLVYTHQITSLSLSNYTCLSMLQSFMTKRSEKSWISLVNMKLSLYKPRLDFDNDWQTKHLSMDHLIFPKLTNVIISIAKSNGSTCVWVPRLLNVLLQLTHAKASTNMFV